MPSFTRADLERHILSGLDDNSEEFPTENIRLVLNHSLARLNLLVGFLRATVTVPGGTVANQLTYTTPAGILIPMRLDCDGETLEKPAFRRLVRAFPCWASDTTAVMGGRVSRWARLGLRQFVLHPMDSTGGGVLEMSGIAPITPLNDPEDAVTLSDQFCEVLVGYARIRLLLKEGGQPLVSALRDFAPLQKMLSDMIIWRDFSWPQFWIDIMQQKGQWRGV